MTGLLFGIGIPLAYLVGWAFGSALVLRTYLQTSMRCGAGTFSFQSSCHEFHGPDCAKPVGEVTGRTLESTFVCCLIGLLWPLLIVPAIVFSRTPLVPAEAHRLASERDRQIARLERELDQSRRTR